MNGRACESCGKPAEWLYSGAGSDMDTIYPYVHPKPPARCRAHPNHDDPTPHCMREDGHSGRHIHYGVWARYEWAPGYIDGKVQSWRGW